MDRNRHGTLPVPGPQTLRHGGRLLVAASSPVARARTNPRSLGALVIVSSNQRCKRVRRDSNSLNGGHMVRVLLRNRLRSAGQVHPLPFIVRKCGQRRGSKAQNRYDVHWGGVLVVIVVVVVVVVAGVVVVIAIAAAAVAVLVAVADAEALAVAVVVAAAVAVASAVAVAVVVVVVVVSDYVQNACRLFVDQF